MKKRGAIIIGAMVALLALIGFGVVLMMSDKTVLELEFEKKITVDNFVPSEEKTEQEFVIEKAGDYVFHATWEYNEERMVTGIEVLNETGEDVFKATANGCDMYSKAIDLEKGTYKLVLTYLASNEQWIKFFENENTEDWEAKPDLSYAGATDGTIEMNYRFEVQKDIPVVGIIFVLGVAAGLILVVILVAAATKGDEVKAKYDERQEIVRGKGFKYAFFAMIIWEIILFTLEPLEIVFPMSLGNASFINVIFGVTVYATYCIWNDGYFALNQKSGLIMTVLIIMGIINLLMGINAFMKGYAWINGQLSLRSMNLFCGIMMIIVCATMLLKKFVKDRKEE